MHWQKITLVGVGLLGGSLGLALKNRRLAQCVMGCVRREESVAEVIQKGAVDQATCDLSQAVADADLIVLCTPLAQMRSLAEQMVPYLKSKVVVTDVGSVKGMVMQELEPMFASVGAAFIGSHPMAGSELAGIDAARADLFEKAVCVITPASQSPSSALAAVDGLWRQVGGRTIRLSPDQHDELVARSSHLVHVVASELANYVLSPIHPKQQAELCSTGFRDTTRVASGSQEVWRDIALANRKNLSRVLGVFIEDLQEFQLALDNGDVKTVAEFFQQARERREQWKGQTGA